MPKRDKGQTTYSWVLPPGSRDEAGDCTRMAYAALQLVARRYNRATMWDQLEAQLESAAPSQPQPSQPDEQRRAGWLNSSEATGKPSRRGWLAR